MVGAASPFSPSTMGPGLDTASRRLWRKTTTTRATRRRSRSCPKSETNKGGLTSEEDMMRTTSTKGRGGCLRSSTRSGRSSSGKAGPSSMGSRASPRPAAGSLCDAWRRRPTVATSPHPPAIQRCDACGDVAMFALMKETTAGRSTIPCCRSHRVHHGPVG